MPGGFGYRTPSGVYGVPQKKSTQIPERKFTPQTFTAPPMTDAAQQYWQQQVGTGGAALTPQQLQAQKNLMTQRAMTGQEGLNEAMMQHFARMGMAGSGAEAEALMRAKLMGQMGLQQQLTGFETEMARDAANRRMQLAGMGFTGAGTLGAMDLQRQQMEYQQMLDQLSDEYYRTQLEDQRRLEEQYRNLWGNQFRTPMLPGTGGIYG